MKYIRVSINKLQESESEILIALLSETGFDAFEEAEGLLMAYIPADIFNLASVNDVLSGFPGIRFKWEDLPDINWNEQWEKEYNPVTINGKCLIRATFHEPQPGFETEIIIEPKMSFGTAHHETTALMIKFLLDHDIRDRDVLDMGCGTGILAILASKLGAREILAIDNDEWAFRNSLENVELNNVTNVVVECGDIVNIRNKNFDITLANINRNILLDYMNALAASVKISGMLVLSGFYMEDLDVLQKRAEEEGMKLIDNKSMNNWTIACFEKSKVN
jgi:ribosomal protein L11 methyltransferase